MAAISIENIIATAHLHHQFNLDHIATQLPEVTYDPSEQAAAIFHFNDPKSAVLLSSDGKLVCTGTTSLSQAEENINEVLTTINRSIDPTITDPPIEQSSILATTDLETTISLETIAIGLSGENIIYQPEINPWIRYHIAENIVILLFQTGRVVFIGNVMISQITEAFETLKDKLSSIGVL
jgi:transcription initiation factor TFIID TATA-box-binding protein